MRMSVDLPAPFGPSNAVTPGPTAKVTSETATRSPNHFETWSTAINGGGGGGGGGAGGGGGGGAIEVIGSPRSGDSATTRTLRRPTSTRHSPRSRSSWGCH